jgi:UDP:flavonoid glycosyltransferase YjiC (YdhE family)
MPHFAFYCSGHGFGHATRVVATTSALLDKGHQVSIVTDARQSIFQDVLDEGATYRKAPIDAGICQPKAYSVDRAKTLAGLQAFLESREERLEEEVEWFVATYFAEAFSEWRIGSKRPV